MRIENLFFAITFFLFAHGSSVAEAQQVTVETAAPSVTDIAGASAIDVSSILKAGVTYDASGPFPGTKPNSMGGTFHHDIVVTEVANRNIVGTVQAYNAGSCGRKTPLAGEIREDGTVYLEATGTVSGCERSYSLKVTADGKLTGTTKTPFGTFPVSLEQKK